MVTQASRQVPDRVGEFALVRLAGAGKPPSKKDLDAALKRYFADPMGMPAAQWSDKLATTLHELQEQGLVDRPVFRLTDQGRARVLTFLSVKSLPGGTKWRQLRDRYLVAKALQIEPQTKAEWERLSTADGLRAAILAKYYQLPIGPVPTLARALHALAWLQLRRTHDVDLPFEKDFTRQAVLSQTLSSGQRSGQLAAGLAARATSSPNTRPEKLRESLICNWLRHKGTAVDEPDLAKNGHDTSAFDLQAFAVKVSELACNSASGRFGDHKVFISHVWDRFQQEPAAKGMTRHEFNRHLVEANREDLLTLSRADLVGAMNPEDVRQSEIRLPLSSFHFIRTDHS